MQTTNTTTTETKKTQPLILERVLAGEIDETGAVKLSQEVAPTLLVQALLKRVGELTKKLEEIEKAATPEAL